MNARIILHDRAAKINNDGSTTEISVKDKHMPINITNGVGPKGDDGNGIVSIQKTETTGLTDTYVITYTNGDTEEFTIENGNGIAGIEKTETDGLIDTYQITYTDPNKEPDVFTVHNGERGDKGDSPEKGVDYWTEEDKAELAQEASELIDLTPYAEKTEVPVEYGTGLGSVKTKDYFKNGTKYNTSADGEGSFATGIFSKAHGNGSQASGIQVNAFGLGSHAEGGFTRAIGEYSHAEGYGEVSTIKLTGDVNSTTYIINKSYPLPIGSMFFYNDHYVFVTDGSTENGVTTITLSETINPTEQLNGSRRNFIMGGSIGTTSHSEGFGTIAVGQMQHVQGMHNVSDKDGIYADVVGNGSSIGDCSNAFALTWTGDGKYAGDVYVHSEPDSSGGNKLATEGYVDDAISHINTMSIHICTVEEYDSATGIPTVENPDASTFYLVPGGDAPNLYIEWVYVNDAWEKFGSATIDLSNYVTFNDIATTSKLGIAKPGNGLYVQGGAFHINGAPDRIIKTGSGDSAPIVVSKQHVSAFYGLAKAAGDTTQSQSDNAVGQYTDEAKAAIQTMLDVPAKSDVPENVSELNNDAGYLTEHQDLSDYALNENVVMVPGTGVGSARTRDFENNGSVYKNEASGIGSFVEGISSFAKGRASHSEGQYNLALGNSSHVEGAFNIATNTQSHAEGLYRVAGNNYSHIEGYGTYIFGTISGDQNTTTYTTNGIDLAKIKKMDLVYTYRLGKTALVSSVDRLNNTITLDKTFENELNNEDVCIYRSYAYGVASHAEGINTITWGAKSHAEGDGSITKGYNSHAEGSDGKALGAVTHSEGTYTVAAGDYSHTENNHTFALGRNAHAQNNGETLSLKISGDDNATTYTYSGNGDPSVGDYIASYENYARITSVDTENKQFTVDKTLVYYLNNEDRYIYRSGAFGENSHVEGKSTTALGTGQHVQGKYNTLDNQGVYADIVGNGTAHTNRSNAYALTWTGDGRYAGDVYVGCDPDSTGGTKLAKVTDIPEIPVQDVQINGTSILDENGIANVPIAGSGVLGAVKINNTRGIGIFADGTLSMAYASSDEIKGANTSFKPITPAHEIEAAFYGLAYAAGASDQQTSDNPVGQYTDEAKLAIRTMLGLDDTSIVNIVQAGLPAAEGVAW